MRKIISLQQAVSIANNLREGKKSIVLIGGCFDILHKGHIIFIEKARKKGDVLFLLLESDKSVRNKKGPERPINTQKDRAYVLSALRDVDFIVMLPPQFKDTQYDNVIIKIKPAIIATTKGDSARKHKERQAELTGAKLLDVTLQIMNHSTSKLASSLLKEL